MSRTRPTAAPSGPSFAPAPVLPEHSLPFVAAHHTAGARAYSRYGLAMRSRKDRGTLFFAVVTDGTLDVHALRGVELDHVTPWAPRHVSVDIACPAPSAEAVASLLRVANVATRVTPAARRFIVAAAKRAGFNLTDRTVPGPSAPEA